VLIDQEDESRYRRSIISAAIRAITSINSALSEEAVLGFEYGYSLAEPKALAVWKRSSATSPTARRYWFDQFISSGERKWLRMSLVCMLPHGYEGQGRNILPRARALPAVCAEDNMQVVYATTPATSSTCCGVNCIARFASL